MHTRETIQKLQHTHADYIEASYRQLSCLPGNPKGIEICKIGETRIFLSQENRLENRAIFTGNETLDELREVTSLFDKKGVEGYFELNPANFYRTEPFSWKSEILPALLELGYFPAMLRCVWYLDSLNRQEASEAKSALIKRYLCTEADAFIEAKLKVEPVDDKNIEKEKRALRHAFTKDWINYIGFEEDDPVSLSKMFIKNDIGYLAWGYTLQEHRRKGHHSLHVLKRCKDAFASGCETVFSVTDFNIPSSISLQKLGFQLAYNYLLLERSPK